MIYPVYIIRDVKVGFSPDFIVQLNEAAAVRGFEYMMSNTNTINGQFPTDFELYQTGEFDTESGTINSIVPPKFIVSGVTFVE